jgi:hypothetical protein
VSYSRTEEDVEWLDIVMKLGMSGTSAMLTYAVITLWKKLETKEVKYEAQLTFKDAEISRLNEKLTQTLIAVSKRSDDD